MHSRNIKLSTFCDDANQFSYFATTKNDYTKLKCDWKHDIWWKDALVFSLTLESIRLERTARTVCGNGYKVTNQCSSISRGQREGEWKTRQETNKGKESACFSVGMEIFLETLPQLSEQKEPAQVHSDKQLTRSGGLHHFLFFHQSNLPFKFPPCYVWGQVSEPNFWVISKNCFTDYELSNIVIHMCRHTIHMFIGCRASQTGLPSLCQYYPNDRSNLDQWSINQGWGLNEEKLIIQEESILKEWPSLIWGEEGNFHHQSKCER